jgi:hypothetical protein
LKTPYIGVQRPLALFWSFVSKITNSKHQITNEFQIPIFNDQNFKDDRLFGFLNFDLWNLIFGILISQWGFKKTNPLSG